MVFDYPLQPRWYPRLVLTLEIHQAPSSTGAPVVGDGVPGYDFKAVLLVPGELHPLLPRSLASTPNLCPNPPGNSPPPDTTSWGYQMQVRCFNGLNPVGLRPAFKNRGGVGEVIVDLDEDANRRSPDNRPCLGAESRVGMADQMSRRDILK